MRIAFIWQGSSDGHTLNHWNDGLREAMRIIERKHEVTYHEPFDEINADLILYWESPITIKGDNSEHYNRVRRLPIRKALLFAGGPLEKEWVEGFDHLFVESKINADECDKLGIPHSTAFGINDKLAFPIDSVKHWDGFHPATCASWKRQKLFAEALGDKGLLCGRNQPTDPQPFIDAKALGTEVMNEQSYVDVNVLMNMSHCLVQTSEFWGGGQRVTLESMSAGIPVICMVDSPKNREYVEESGAGLVVEPDPNRIKEAIEIIKGWTKEEKERGIAYVKSKWTAQHYADNLLKWIDS